MNKGSSEDLAMMLLIVDIENKALYSACHPDITVDELAGKWESLMRAVPESEVWKSKRMEDQRHLLVEAIALLIEKRDADHTREVCADLIENVYLAGQPELIGL